MGKPTYQDFLDYKYGCMKMGWNHSAAFSLACSWLKTRGSSFKEITSK